MGYYINKLKDGTLLPTFGKAEKLIEAGAKITDGNKFQENLVCVVDNIIFEAAGYAYSEREFEAFKNDDGRPRTWLIVPDAAKLSGYTE